jgi:3-methylcrotonyl-CoA carboxylase alpha subunit
LFKRLLIANRGEIVCRIARTAQRLGLTTIAVYSDADRSARHVRLADEAYHLGASPAAASYLDSARIIALARRVGADAIHPGYGFLSENAHFARACAQAGLIFIGPPADAILAMGSKSASKAAMAAVGVPVAPGYHGSDQTLERLRAEAERVGFPLLVKASAGGGGKGMQVVHSSAEVTAALDSAQRLARTAFADDRLLLERYFPRARHVEVQVFADTHGAAVTLFDRDCSVQRRHQKIVEEAPAPGLRADVRAAMSQAALTAARSVEYVGAGTVEFLLDEAQHFYFMEMNTRLQVEHPVTELITGIDLVEWQIRIARGEPLPQTASEITQRGTAVEARLYAEDPAQEYLPSVGRISHLRWPDPAVGLRLDYGVDAGDEVSPYYDPLLGKIIAWGESRTEATDRLGKALGDIEVTGVITNRALLRSVVADEEFRRGGVATDFLAVRHDYLAFGEPNAEAEDYLCAALWCVTQGSPTGEAGVGALWSDTQGWRLGASPTTSWRFGERSMGQRGGGERSVTVELTGPQCYVACWGSETRELRLLGRSDCSLVLELVGGMRRVHVVQFESELHLFEGGRHVTLRLLRTEDALQVAAGAEEGSLLTPLPGTVVAVHVNQGQRVAHGAPLVTVEAMKMEHTLTAPYAGVVARIAFGIAERVPAGAVLVEMSRDAA